MSEAIRPLHALFFLLLCFFSADAAANTAAIAACQDQARKIIRIGVTQATSAYFPELGIGNADNPCLALAQGNDYQILDWLENGQIDAGIVSPFAVTLLFPAVDERGDELENPGDIPPEPFLHYSRVLPFDGAPLEGYALGMRLLTAETGPAGAPGARLDALLESVARGATINAVFILESHLDPALPVLIDYVAARLAMLGLPAELEESHFWSGFLTLLQFRLQDHSIPISEYAVAFDVVRVSAQAAASDLLMLPTPEPLSDYFVYRASVADRFTEAVEESIPPSFGDGLVRAWLDSPLQDARKHGAAPLFGFLQENYNLTHLGARKQRHFRFSIPELFNILHPEEDSAADSAQFGLVLTGGGVKAAFQTHLVDHLYDNLYLTNTNPEAAPGGVEHDTLKVDHIVGTSGGALLGLFVSAIQGRGTNNLTDLLWRTRSGNYISNADVFPWLEAPRYLSGLVSVLVFTVVFFLARRVPKLSGLTDPKSVPEPYADPEELRGGFPPRAIWILLLAGSPWILKIVNGEGGLQHVPAISGVFYLGYALIAVYSDNRLRFGSKFAWQRKYFSVRDYALFGLGALLVLVAAGTEHFAESIANRLLPVLGATISLATLVACIGFLVIFVRLHFVFARLSERGNDTIELVDNGYIFRAFGILIAVPVLVQLAVVVAGGSTFELTGSFWRFLLFYSVVVSVLVIAAGYASWENSLQKFVRTGLDFLAVNFPKSTYLVNAKRYQRIALFLIMSFGYWNLVMAPALYGNDTAKSFLETTYLKPVCPDADRDDCDVDIDGDLVWAPNTPLVISATSLMNERERYYVFHPDIIALGSCADPEGCECSIAAVDGGALIDLQGADPRWAIADCTATNRHVIDTAFASGSPFPVFPATQVFLPGYAPEWLVDGGFAHNIPVEASRQMGAGKILVLSSSPLHVHDLGAEEVTWQQIGNLFSNLGRLFPYLFNRSQVEDALSAEGAMVATLAPRYRDDWPMLTDFRPSVIEDVVAAAKEDLSARIGMIESWGPPSCLFADVRYTCAGLSAIDL